MPLISALTPATLAEGSRGNAKAKDPTQFRGIPGLKCLLAAAHYGSHAKPTKARRRLPPWRVFLY